ncbi:MAG: PAS domain S-box protein [Limnothrix sp.]
MSQTKTTIALLSVKAETYHYITDLFAQSSCQQFELVWIDLRHAPPPEKLPLYDVYLSDALYEYLFAHHAFIKSHRCFWLATSELSQQEILYLGVTDCFLMAEFNIGLLQHCLRQSYRTRPTLSRFQAAPRELWGDRLQTLFDNVPGIIYSCLPSEKWQGLYFSNAIEAISGYPATDFMIGGQRDYVDIVHPEDTAIIERIVKEKLASKENFRIEYRLIHRDGSTVWVEEKGQGIFDEVGKLLWLNGVILDISEKKKLVSDLQQQQRHYYEKTPAMLYSINEQTEIASVSDHWLEVMGYERQEVIGRQPTDFLTSQSRQYATDQMIPLLKQQGHVQDVEYQFVKKDGQVIDILLSATQKDLGAKKHFLAVLTDVTARNKLTEKLNQYQNHLQDLVRQSTKALADSEMRFRTLFNLAPMGIVQVDLDGYFQLANQQFLEMLNLSRETLLTSQVTDITYGADEVEVASVLQRLRQGKLKTSFIDQRYRRGDDWFWGHTEITVVKDLRGQPQYVIATIEDIHERKMMEESLRVSEARLAKTQAIAHVSGWEWDVMQNHTYWSAESFKLFGVSVGSIEQNAETFYQFLHPGDRPRIQALIQSILDGETAPATMEYRLITPDGQLKFIKDYLDVTRHESGQVTHISGATQDITEIRTTIKALEASEARFRGVFDQVALGIFQVNMDGQFLIANQAFCELVGYSVAELESMTWPEISHPDDVPICTEKVKQLIQGSIETIIWEKRYIHKQGHLIWIKAIVSCIYDKQDQPQYLLCLIEDISAYKEAQAQLAQSQNRYRDLIEGIHAVIYQYSSEKGGLFYSSRVRDILGYDPDFLAQNGSVWYEEIHPSDRLLVDQQLATLQAGQNFSIEYRIRDAAGHWHWINDKTFQVEQVGTEFIINGFARDITQRKLADAALNYRLQLEATLADISHRMIIDADLDLVEILALLSEVFRASHLSVMVCRADNPTTLDQLCSWKADEAKDCPVVKDEVVDLTDYPWWLAQWQQQKAIVLASIDDIPATGQLEQEILADLGIHAVMLVPIKNHQQEAWGYIKCAATEVPQPAWSREDAELLAIAGDLIYSYTTRQQAQQQLEQAKETAEIANQAKTQFLTNITHELRTPLNAILGFAQLMETSKTFPEEHRNHLSILRRSGQRLLSLLNDILALSSFEGGEPQLNKMLFSLSGLLEDLENMFQPIVSAQPALTLKIIQGKNLPRYISTDQTKLHSVLIHLLSNGLKFTSQGHVSLEVTVVSQAPLVIRFRVTDTGVGITAADQAKLFDNFVKLEAGEQLGQGSGIGLALSQKFVKLMGGEISIESKVNGGSCFSFELRCDEYQQQARGRSPANLQQTTPTLDKLVPADLQTLSPEWRGKFHLAAASARTKTLKKLIAELPPESAAIAQSLATLIEQLDFEQLSRLTAAESQPSKPQ